jgi:hypothetical protein
MQIDVTRSSSRPATTAICAQQTMSNLSLSTGSVVLLLDGYRDMGRPGLLIMVGKSELRTFSARRRTSASLWAWEASRARSTVERLNPSESLSLNSATVHGGCDAPGR